MPTAPSDKRMLNARIPNPEFAAVEAIARREQTDRTMAARLMLAFAARFMPKGWRPDNAEFVCANCATGQHPACIDDDCQCTVGGAMEYASAAEAARR